jgi:hypothetical protein
MPPDVIYGQSALLRLASRFANAFLEDIDQRRPPLVREF